MNVDVDIEAEEVVSPKQALVRLTLSSGLVHATGLLTAADAIGYGQMLVRIGKAAQKNHAKRKADRKR